MNLNFFHSPLFPMPLLIWRKSAINSITTANLSQILKKCTDASDNLFPINSPLFHSPFFRFVHINRDDEETQVLNNNSPAGGQKLCNNQVDKSIRNIPPSLCISPSCMPSVLSEASSIYARNCSFICLLTSWSVKPIPKNHILFYCHNRIIANHNITIMI